VGKNICQPSDNTEIYRTITVKKYRYKRKKRKTEQIKRVLTGEGKELRKQTSQQHRQ